MGKAGREAFVEARLHVRSGPDMTEEYARLSNRLMAWRVSFHG